MSNNFLYFFIFFVSHVLLRQKLLKSACPPPFKTLSVFSFRGYPTTSKTNLFFVKYTFDLRKSNLCFSNGKKGVLKIFTTENILRFWKKGGPKNFHHRNIFLDLKKGVLKIFTTENIFLDLKKLKSHREKAPKKIPQKNILRFWKRGYFKWGDLKMYNRGRYNILGELKNVRDNSRQIVMDKT